MCKLTIRVNLMNNKVRNSLFIRSVLCGILNVVVLYIFNKQKYL